MSPALAARWHLLSDPLRPIKDGAAANDDNGEKQPGASGGEFAFANFTPREVDLLAELRCGSSNKVIADKLNLSDHTVKMHLQHMLQNRTEVVALLGDVRAAVAMAGIATGNTVVSAASFRVLR